MGDLLSWPPATVVVLLYKPGERELRTLSLVAEQDYPASVTILVIDSTPEPIRSDLKEFQAAVDQWETISTESFEHGRTRNMAALKCRTPVVTYLSQDAHPQGTKWLQSLVRPLAEGRAEASYGRQVSPLPNEERQATFGFLYPEASEVKTKDSVPILGLRTFHFSDVTSAFRTDVIRKVGFPTHLPTFEDVGVAKRLLDAGLRIAYVPDAVVAHAHDMNLREVAHRYRQIGAIYEQLGIFEELKRGGRPLLREGMRVGRQVSGTPAGGFRAKSACVGMGFIKLSAVAWGRREARRGQTASVLGGP